MARHLFIAQQTLATWSDQDKIDFDDNVMTIKADGRAFKLIEAVRFVKIEGDEEDKPGLLGRVKTNQQLEKMGAERYRDSVLFEDVAYKVQEGFIGEVFMKEPAAAPAAPVDAAPAAGAASGGQARAAKPPPPPPPPPPQPARADKESARTAQHASPLQASLTGAADPSKKKSATDEQLSDEELLTRFLLDNL